MNTHPPQSEIATHSFYNDVLVGLRLPQKQIPSKYLYDERGSKLFDQICHLDEYYLTRAESQIMATHGQEMSNCIGSNVALVELGSGSSEKTRMLLDQLSNAVAYLPVDISAAHLHSAAERIQIEYPTLTVHPIIGDFIDQIQLPPVYRTQEICIYFPGSTIGNLGSDDASGLLD